MTRLFEILISLAIVAVLFLLVALVLPSSRHLTESVETNRKLTIVYDTLNSLRRFEDWNALVLHAPDAQLELSGPDEGVGARMTYDTTDKPNVGDGSWEIIDSVPNQSVTYALTNPQRGTNKTVTYTLERTGTNNRNVKITQSYDVDYGWNLLGRYAGLYVSGTMGEDMKTSLRSLSDMLAAVPNYDYSLLSSENPAMAPKLAQRDGETLLVVTAAVDRTNVAVHKQMDSNMEWITKVMEANDLEPAGPVRIITNEYGTEIYSFDVAQPVRKVAGAESDDDEDSGEEGSDEEVADDAEGEAAAGEVTAAAGDEPGATEPAPAAMIKGIEVSGEKNPVEVAYSEPSLVAVVPFMGHMANLPKVRDALRAWALTRGYITTERPYEQWLNGFDKGFTVDGRFNVVWSLKAEPGAQVPTIEAVTAPVWQEITAKAEAAKAEAEAEAEGEDAEAGESEE